MTEKPTWQPTFVEQGATAAHRPASEVLADAIGWETEDGWPVVEVGTPVLSPDGKRVAEVAQVFDDGGFRIGPSRPVD